jgi:hypothetical protein
MERISLISRAFPALVILGSLVAARPVAAQTSVPFPPVATSEPAGHLFIGGIAGAGSVQNVGGAAGAELGLRVANRIDLFAEGVWMQDVATRHRLGLASEVASILQTSQGSVATGTIEAPAVCVDAGARFTLTGGRVRPYVVIGAGMARMTLKPTFTLGGSNVTASLPTYGVTLGSDLSGESTEPAFTGGLGLRMAQGRWYLDGGLRVTRIQAVDEGITAVRASVTFGLIF